MQTPMTASGHAESASTWNRVNRLPAACGGTQDPKSRYSPVAVYATMITSRPSCPVT